MQRPAIVLALAAATFATGCSDAWYRVTTLAEGLLITRADAEADTCDFLLLSLSSEYLPDDQIIRGIKIDAEGADVVVAGAFEGSGARECGTLVNPMVTPRVEVSEGRGRIRIKDVSVEDGIVYACRMDVNVEVAGVRYRADDLFVWGSGCEPLPSETVEYTRLSAAYPGADERLTIAGWDPTHEACAWMQFAYLGYGDSVIAMPAGWDLLGSYVSDVNEDECDAALIPEAAEDALSRRGILSLGDGALRFTETRPSPDDPQVEIPCAIEIDGWIQHHGSYHWEPARVRLSGALEVAGACEG